MNEPKSATPADKQREVAVEAAIDFLTDREYWNMSPHQRRTSAFEILEFSAQRCTRIDTSPVSADTVQAHHRRSLVAISQLRRIPQTWRKYYTDKPPTPLPKPVTPSPAPLGAADIERIWVSLLQVGIVVPSDTPNPLADETEEAEHEQ